MTEDLIDFSLQENESSIIKVIGVGGGGGNAVNYMYKQGIKDVDFVICNTDAQALETSEIPVKIQLGESLTEGRGAGNKPERGEQSAIENLEDIIEVLADNTKMVFITAGMGGGTGTGAAPVIAKAAKEMGILTVGIVTIPFRFEGRQRLHQAIEGINKLKENVDSLLVINNEKLSEIYGDLKLSTAFSKADDVLATAAKGIAEIITLHGYINVDFEDVKTVMTDSGVAVMGSASAEGENRAVNAIREALTSPLLNSNDVRGARNILLNISSGQEEVTMDEVGQITDYVQEAVGDSASIIWGTGQDLALENKVSVTIIATGFDNGLIPEEKAAPKATSFQAGRGRNSVADKMKNILDETENEKPEENKLILTDLKDTEIDEIENIPAYKRKLKNIDNQKFQSGKVIRFTLDEE
ncbi:cell division protein FtsZ [Labilibaculum sp.]|uniref:cell division protein FtsZ n=1 Tax=Labilibaculum sp. TaxID=2060723 RepID=UPI002AA679FD|nr:cell division protein FtsZ [Labilibaculum sp.]